MSLPLMNSPIIHYTANGSQTEFSFPFILFAADQLHIFIDNIRKHDGYIINHLHNPDGGTVVFDTAPQNGARITLKRHIAIRRISNFIEGGELSSRALNAEFDQQTAIAQQLELGQSAAIRFPDSDSLPPAVLPTKEIRANRVIGFDDEGAMILHQLTQGGTGGEGNGGGGTLPAVDYVQSGEGGILRELTDKVTEYVSVKDFGAKGNGLADDTQAFTLALAAHDCVFVPAGTYRILDTIELTHQKTLRGSGAASILIAEDNNFDLLEITGTGNHLAELTLQGGETGLRLYGKNAPCRDNLVQNIRLNGQNTAIELDGYIDTDHPCHYNTLHHVTIIDPFDYGVLITRSGAGTAPERNHLSHIRILSENHGINAAAIAIESAAQRTMLSHCSADIYGDAPVILTIGGESAATLIHDFQAVSHSPMTGIRLLAGSTDTMLDNLRIDTTESLIDDLSGGAYNAANISALGHDKTGHAEFSSLLTHQNFYKTLSLAPPGPIAIYADLTCGIYLLDATNGPLSFQLPKATASNQGALLTLIKTDSTDHPIMLFEMGGTGPNNHVFAISSMHDRVTVISDGSIWRIVQTNIKTISNRIISEVTNYSLDASKDLHLVDASSALVNVILPNAATDLANERMIAIKKTDSSANFVRITEAGGSGPDNATTELKTLNASVTVISNGANWIVTART